MKAYYNEHDPKAAAWLRELMKDGLIAEGDVDERSIEDVVPAELAGYTRCHFFAGIGVWDYALGLAGWPDERPVWTGSCPCQPFSAAGKREGFADERHLWPAWFHLIDVCRPDALFGEQVANGDGLAWLDVVSADLEGIAYTVGAVDIPAAGVGAPHIRQRLFFVADSDAGGSQDRWSECSVPGRHRPNDDVRPAASELRNVSGVADTDGRDARTERIQRSGQHGCEPENGRAGRLDDPAGPRLDGTREGAESQARHETRLCGPERGCTTSNLGDTNGQGRSVGVRITGNDGTATKPATRETAIERGFVNGFWRNAEWIYCRDGKYRPIFRPTQSIFQLGPDGIADYMGAGWGEITAQIEKEIKQYADRTETDPGKELLALWESVAQETLQRNAGRFSEIPEPEILLIALCELAGSAQSKFVLSAPDLGAVQESTLRILQFQREIARSPSERGLDGPPTGESANAVRELPSQAPQHEESEVSALRSEVAETRDVPETFPAVAEIWRSFLKESSRIARLRDGKRVVIASDGFPLAEKTPGRVGLLRGAGNAICAEVAKEFIAAYLDLER